jgi:hypothetical protein
MSADTFTSLARWLAFEALDATTIGEGNLDLFGDGLDKLGPLEEAITSLDCANLLSAVAHLDAVINLALKPLERSTKGRNQMDRFRFATNQRDSLRKTALIARVLVLDAIKAEGGAA